MKPFRLGSQDNMTMVKSPMSVLQEKMIKMGRKPEYECISQTGPHHAATFEYCCRADGLMVKASAHSKKEAKQEAARLMLLHLAARESSPSEFSSLKSLPELPTTSIIKTSSTSYVALLKFLCVEYRLPAVQYDLVGDTGPHHARLFTVRARLDQHERIATASTKKAARQQAAEQLYTYMRDNLATLKKDYADEEALLRAHEHALERLAELGGEEVWRPDLGQRVADYHLGLITHTEPEKCEQARIALEGDGDGPPLEKEEEVLEAVAAALGLEIKRQMQPTWINKPMCLLELTPASPALMFAGIDARAATSRALSYLRLALAYGK